MLKFEIDIKTKDQALADELCDLISSLVQEVCRQNGRPTNTVAMTFNPKK
jgi:hypothetical protein